MVALVETKDAAREGASLGWATNGWVAAHLRAKPRFAGGEEPLMEGPAQLAGYPVAATSSISGSTVEPGALVFGDWSSLLVGYWSGTDLLVNPYEGAAYSRGRVLVRAMRDCDVQARHIASFAACMDVREAP